MIKRTFFKKNYFFNSKILTFEIGNKLIFDSISQGKPLMISRFGLTELFTCKNYIEIQSTTTGNFFKREFYRKRGYSKDWKENIKKEINELSGVFPPSPSQLEDFSRIYIKSATEADYMAIWNMAFEPYFINSYCKKSILLDPISIEPYYHDVPWSRALSGKKVLVIHPFDISIQEQYSKRELLFANKEILPEFELKTIKAVQSLAGNSSEYVNWNDAFNSMCKLIDKIDFDIAVIGAGAYGLPLSAYIKQKGKIAIHLGGATQILFGIKGKRWDNHLYISRLYNENWIRPHEEEIPKNFLKTDSGCYW